MSKMNLMRSSRRESEYMAIIENSSIESISPLPVVSKFVKTPSLSENPKISLNSYRLIVKPSHSILYPSNNSLTLAMSILNNYLLAGVISVSSIFAIIFMPFFTKDLTSFMSEAFLTKETAIRSTPISSP